jgi:diacylglycerol kinase (ATP)
MDRSVAVDRLFRATVDSWHGLRVAARSEAAVREELVLLVLAVPLAVLVAEGALKRFVLIAVILLLIVVELLNTAIEKLADEITTAPRPGIRRIKDMGSAAVGITLVIAGLAWLAAVGQRLSFW